MSGIQDYIGSISRFLNSYIWGTPMVVLILATGILMTVGTGFFQLVHIKHWLSNSVGTAFKRDNCPKDKNLLSPFQALCTALAATIGTGNIAGVAVALATGGPGAVFWMWVSAFFGMMTAYGENVLGIYYRHKEPDGTCSGGPMYYIKNGLGEKLHSPFIGKALAFAFCIFCIFASFGMGNLVQINSISTAISANFGTRPVTVAVVIAILASVIILGGSAKIGKVTEKLVPLMAAAYIAGTLLIFFLNCKQIPYVFSSIFSEALGFEPAVGGIGGYLSKRCIEIGFKRGVFSNEAGIGSSAMAHSASDAREPAVQGMLGIFAVFFDTIVVCTLTAFVLLSCSAEAFSLEEALTDIGHEIRYIYLDGEHSCGSKKTVPLISKKENQVSGYTNIAAVRGITLDENGNEIKGNTLPVNSVEYNEIEGVELVTYAFSQRFGSAAGKMIAIAVLLFAFSTIIGWSFYGIRAWEYVFGSRLTALYKLIFISLIVIGARLNMELIWDVSDTFNGLMAIPNLAALIALSKTVFMITRKYVRQNKKRLTH